MTMAILRLSTAVSKQLSRSSRSRICQPTSIRHLSLTQSLFTQGYGDAKRDPKAEKSQDQGSSSEVTQKAEHPGPEPPAEGRGTGAGPTKARSQKSPEDASASSGGARSKEAKETGSSPTGGSVGSNPASPKIHDKSTPGVSDAAKKAEVEEHNREFEQGHDRGPPAAPDKVDKAFWKGHGGVDKDA